MPFSFGDEQFNLDESVTTVCSVLKGDLPLKIWWSFEDVNHESSQNISTNDGIIITRSSQKVSMLMIEAVKARHRGNYTCYAKNRGGISAQSAYLAINGSQLFLYKTIADFVIYFSTISKFIDFDLILSLKNQSLSNHRTIQLWRRRIKH